MNEASCGVGEVGRGMKEASWMVGEVGRGMKEASREYGEPDGVALMKEGSSRTGRLLTIGRLNCDMLEVAFQSELDKGCVDHSLMGREAKNESRRKRMYRKVRISVRDVDVEKNVVRVDERTIGEG